MQYNNVKQQRKRNLGNDIGPSKYILSKVLLFNTG